MKFTFGKLVNLIVVLVLLQATAFSALAAGTGPTRPDPKGPATTPSTDSGAPAPAFRASQPEKLSKDLIGITDSTSINVSIRGTMASLAEVAKSLDAAGRLAYAARVDAFQTEMEKGIVANGGRVIYRYRTLGSGVIASVPANKVVDVSRLPGVAHISRPQDYQLDLSETVGFIGGDTLKALGLKGKGAKIAILDSGLDYTHLAFGGSADPTLWEQAYYGSDPACINGDEPECANRKAVSPQFAGLFGPNGLRVKGGFDWVGPTWTSTSGDLLPDPNPIALAGTGTHGTHVADIIGGLGYPAGSYQAPGGTVNYPAKGEGMAPEADLYAFTVCSAIGTSCSGLAMLQGMDSAADLDNNPATIDPADVLNMSLGSDFGQPEDDSTWLTGVLTKYGTIVVQSAGNGGDKPYVVGSPSIASSSISVAQTSVPSAKQFRVVINTPLAIAGDLDAPYLHDWSAEYYTHAITADVVYDNTNAATRIGCSTAAGAAPAEWIGTPTRFSGKIVLVDRGSCGASFKVGNAYAAGAALVLVAMIAPGPAYPFSYAGGTFAIPSFSITQADGNKIKSAYATPPMPAAVVTLANVTADPKNFVSLAYSIASTSSRGPRNHDNKIKPDVGAPGASVSAVAGTGSQSAAFGGTSGAAPMVTGAMALLKDLYKDQQNFINPQLSVQQYKILLMNSANNMIAENKSAFNPDGTLLPIARIGAGQVDLTKALTTKILAYDVTEKDPQEWTGSLSYQYAAVSGPTTITRTLRILNLNPFEKTVVVGYDFRYAYQDNGAVSLNPSQSQVTIPAGQFKDVDIVMHIDPSALAPWFDWNNWWVVDRGSLGGNGDNFKQVEYDGYVYVGETVATWINKITTVPFLVIPKPVAEVDATVSLADPKDASPGAISLTNTAGVTSHTDLFNLVDESPNQGYTVGSCASSGNIPGCNFTVVDLKDVGYRMWQTGASSYIDFGISLWDNPYRAGSVYPMGLQIYIDTLHPVTPGSTSYVPGPDGFEDYMVYFAENGGFGASGQSVVFVKNLHSTAAAPGYFYLDSTFDSNNFILTVPAAAIGLSIPLPISAAPQATAASKMNFAVAAWDTWLSGSYTDFSPAAFGFSQAFHSVDVLADRFHIDMVDQAQTIAEGATVKVPYTLGAPADWLASGSQIGFLAMYREAPIQKESKALVITTNLVKNLVYVPVVAPGGDPSPFAK